MTAYIMARQKMIGILHVVTILILRNPEKGTPIMIAKDTKKNGI